MYKRVLIALDLEGVNNVAGEPYSGLVRGCEQWKVACCQAALEVNAAASALFEIGVETVGLWDNHGGGGNINPDDLDERIIFHSVDNSLPRMSFAVNEYDCIYFFGYHAMEGTLGGVLAHTMSSVSVQHYKINGKYVGEIDMDAAIASEHGIVPSLFVGGNIACAQAKKAVPGIVTVETKEELSRNKAIFRNNSELFEDIKKGAVNAASAKVKPAINKYPFTFEKSFKRVEDAEKYITAIRNFGIDTDYVPDEILGKNAHSVESTVNNIDEFIKCI